VLCDLDLRGPDVAADALHALAQISPSALALPTLDRDPGEGVGLLCVISGRRGSNGVSAARAAVDPTQASIFITTDETPRRVLSAAARTEAEFVSTWGALVGRTTAKRPARNVRTQ
jgi:hypothetical protein